MKRKTYYYFSYGSNNLQQLADRVKHVGEFEHEPGFIRNHIRIFSGYSGRWDGAVASFYPAKNKTLDGVAVKLTEKELKELDKYEGGYTRIRKKVYIASKPDSYVIAYIYLKDNQVFNKMPSVAYLEAIHKNIAKDIIPIYGVLKNSNKPEKQAVWKKGQGIVADSQ